MLLDTCVASRFINGRRRRHHLPELRLPNHGVLVPRLRAARRVGSKALSNGRQAACAAPSRLAAYFSRSNTALSASLIVRQRTISISSTTTHRAAA